MDHHFLGLPFYNYLPLRADWAGQKKEKGDNENGNVISVSHLIASFVNIQWFPILSVSIQLKRWDKFPQISC